MDRSSVLTLARGEAGSRGGLQVARGLRRSVRAGTLYCPPPPPGKAPWPRWPPPSPSSSSSSPGSAAGALVRKEGAQARPERSGTPGLAARSGRREGVGGQAGKGTGCVIQTGVNRPARRFLKLTVTRERWGSELSPPAQGVRRFPGEFPCARDSRAGSGHPLVQRWRQS